MPDNRPDEPVASGSERLTRLANVATIASHRVNRWTLIFTVLGVVIAIVVAFVSCGGPGTGSGQSAQASGSGININQNSGTQNQPSAGSCGQVGNYNTCTIQSSVTELERNAPNDDQFKAELAKKSTVAPQGPGPWPFIIVDTAEFGLYARSSNEAMGNRVGLSLNRTVIWVDCVATSTFVPPNISNDVGPQWLLVRWKNDQVSEQAMQSDPTDAKRAWMYRGYTVPLYHNGNIPPCPT